MDNLEYDNPNAWHTTDVLSQAKLLQPNLQQLASNPEELDRVNKWLIFQDQLIGMKHYIIGQIGFSVWYLVQVFILAGLATTQYEVPTTTTQTNIHRVDPRLLAEVNITTPLYYPNMQSNSPTHTAWIADVGFIIGFLMSMGNAIHAYYQYAEWDKTNKFDSAMVRGHRPVMWFGRMFMVGVLWALTYQQSGNSDVRSQSLMGFLAVMQLFCWWATERVRGIDLFSFIGVCGLVIVFWCLVIWQSITTDETAGSDTNWYTVAMLIITLVYSVGFIICNLFDLNNTPYQINNQRIDFLILLAYDMLLASCFSGFVWTGFAQLTLRPPLVLRPYTVACFPLRPVVDPSGRCFPLF